MRPARRRRLPLRHPAQAQHRLRQAARRACPADAPAILADCVGYLPERLAGQRQITLRLETGRIIRIATNDLDAPAAEIAALYRGRWQIELFFRWIKQNLKIRKFLGSGSSGGMTWVLVAELWSGITETALVIAALDAAIRKRSRGLEHWMPRPGRGIRRSGYPGRAGA